MNLTQHNNHYRGVYRDCDIQIVGTLLVMVKAGRYPILTTRTIVNLAEDCEKAYAALHEKLPEGE